LYYLTFYKKRLEKERLQILSGLLDTDNSLWKYIINKRKAILSLSAHISQKLEKIEFSPTNPRISTEEVWFINEKATNVEGATAEFTGSLNNEDSTKIVD
jgi:hypothetical protein